MSTVSVTNRSRGHACIPRRGLDTSLFGPAPFLSQITTEKHRMSFPETVDEILDVSEDEGRSLTQLGAVGGGQRCGRYADARWRPDFDLVVTPVSVCLLGVAQLTLGRPVSVSVSGQVARQLVPPSQFHFPHFSLCICLLPTFLLTQPDQSLRFGSPESRFHQHGLTTSLFHRRTSAGRLRGGEGPNVKQNLSQPQRCKFI